MREELLTIIEKNSRIDLKELAVRLGKEEIDVVNELQKLEEERILFFNDVHHLVYSIFVLLPIANSPNT